MSFFFALYVGPEFQNFNYLELSAAACHNIPDFFWAQLQILMVHKTFLPLNN